VPGANNTAGVAQDMAASPVDPLLAAFDTLL
jgi:hypothetical protein